MTSSKFLFVLTALLGISFILSMEAVSARELPQQTQEKVHQKGYEEQKTFGVEPGFLPVVGSGLIPGGYYGYGYLPRNGYYNGFGPGYFPGYGYSGGYNNGYPYIPLDHP